MTDTTPGQKQAPAGKYRLKAIWNEIVSEFGKPRDFVKHLPGDIVELGTEDAERFLRHSLVEPLSAEAKASAAATEETPVERAKAINDQVGQAPIASGEGQQAIPDPVNPTSPVTEKPV